MRINCFIGLMSVAIFAVLSLDQIAQAALLIKIDKSTQRMTVTLDGAPFYEWPVSTGARGYATPNGTFKPFRMDIDHFSQEWDNAPMPYSIFFTRTGVAVHGTHEQRHLGRPVSHGCVRLSIKNAATLWKLVLHEKMANTTVVVTGLFGEAGAVANSHPLRIAPAYREPPSTSPPPEAPALPFPFSLFVH